MKTPRTLVPLLLAALPLAAMAQSEVTQARIVGPGGATYRDDVRVCMERQDSLADRKGFIERERRANDQEAADIARDGARLADELRRLDSSNTAAVADYNMRSAEHNRRVEAHNRRIADMNSAVALLNGDTADTSAYCNDWASRLR